MKKLITLLAVCMPVFCLAQRPAVPPPPPPPPVMEEESVEEEVYEIDPPTYQRRVVAKKKTEPVPAGTPYPESASRQTSNTYKGFVSKGEWVVPPNFLELPKDYAPEGMVAQSDTRLYGVIDGYGRTLIPFRYREELKRLYLPKDHSGPPLFQVKQGRLTGLLDAEGREVLPIEYGYISHERRGIYLVSSRGGNGLNILFDATTGKRLYPEPVKGGFKEVAGGKLLITTPDGSFLINRAGEKVSAVYEELRYVSDAGDKAHTPVLVAKKDDLVGVMSVGERAILPMEYESVFFSKNGNFVVGNKAGKKGLWRPDEGFIVAPAYDEIRTADRNPYYSIRVKAPGQEYGTREGIMDYDGKVLMPPVHERIEYVGTGVVAVHSRSGRQLMDLKGGVVDTTKYASVSALAPGYAIVQKMMTREALEALPRGTRLRFAVLDLRTARLLTGYVYDRVRVSSRRSDFKIMVERAGFRGTLNALGVENADFELIKKPK